MQINSEHSLQVAARTLDRFGDWTRVHAVSRMIDGVLVVPTDEELARRGMNARDRRTAGADPETGPDPKTGADAAT